jgi:hypothetical protein
MVIESYNKDHSYIYKINTKQTNTILVKKYYFYIIKNKKIIFNEIIN